MNDAILTDVTFRNSSAGFFLNDIFYGIKYQVAPANGNVVTLSPDIDRHTEIKIDLSTVILENIGGVAETPTGIQERAALLSTYVR